jgi:hypothetical protein
MVRQALAVDFFQLIVGTGTGEKFETLLDRVGELSIKDQLVHVRHVPMRLEELKRSRGFYTGDMVTFRMQRLPSRAALYGPTKTFDLTAEEGMGEHNAFLFDPFTRVVALERHRSGVSGATFSTYVATASNTSEAVVAAPCIRADAIRKLTKIKDVRSVEVGVAQVNPEALREAGMGVFGFFDLISRTRAANMRVRLSMGYERDRSMNKKEAIALTQAALRLHGSAGEGSEVTFLEVGGHNDSDEQFAINLLKDRLIAEVPLGDAGRHVSYQVRAAAVRQAFEAHRKELEGLYRSS